MAVSECLMTRNLQMLFTFLTAEFFGMGFSSVVTDSELKNIFFCSNFSLNQ